jgi:hypothetical protein
METVAESRKRAERSDSDSSDSKIPIYYTSSADKTDQEYESSPQMKNPKKVLKIDSQTTYIPYAGQADDDDYFLSEVVDKDPTMSSAIPNIMHAAVENSSVKSTRSSSSAKIERAVETSVKSIVASVSNSALAEDVRNNIVRVFSNAKIAESSSSTNLPTIITRTNSTATILCVLEDPGAVISCRSFEDMHHSHRCIPVYIALPAIRIVHDHDSIRDIPEYQVQLTIDGTEYTRWKRFEDFRSLGDACTAYQKYLQKRESHHQKRYIRQNFYFGSHDFFRYFDGNGSEEELPECKMDQNWATNAGVSSKSSPSTGTSSKKTGSGKKDPLEERVFNSQSLQNTVEAWQEVLKHRPWWRIQPYDLYSLKTESMRLENFLKHVLFDIPNMAMLLEFMQ